MNSNPTCSVASLLRFSGLLLLALPLPSRALTASAAPGQIVTFSVSAEGNAPFAYRWFKDGQELVGATTAAHTISSAAALDAGTYVAEVRNAMGATLSDAATLTIAPVETAPVITASPASQTVFAGAAVSFSGSASGTPAPAYQWLKDGVPLPGATAGTFTLATASLADAGMYTLTATNSVGTATSAPAVLTVNPPLTAPVFALQPASQTVFAGASVSFTASASGNPAPAYQWRRDGTAIAGATNATFSLASAALADSGTYTVTATNSVGTATSAPAVLTVNPPLTAPIFALQPASQTVFAGAAVSFTASASGNPAPAYQWRRDGTAIAGATNATFSLASAALADMGTYTVTATNSVGTATSAPAVLTVNPPLTAPIFALQPASQTVFAGAAVSFTASASGNPAPAYQWRRDGTAIAGATNATFSLASAALADSGTYTVTATNSVGTATSAPAVLTVNPPLTVPIFALQPASQTVFAGAAVSFTASASGNPAPAYQWRRDGTAIAGATNATFSLASAALADMGTYTVTATNSVGTATSAPAVLTVNASSGVPVFTLQPVSQSVMEGGSVALEAAASGNPAPTIQWFKDGLVLPGATGGVYGITNVVAGSAGAYHAVAQNSAGSTTSATALITVSSAPALPVITSQPVGQTVIAGATVTFTVIATGSPAPSYRWCVQVKSGRTVTKTYLPGATAPSLTLVNVTTANAGTYSVEVSNSAGTILSAGAVLKVTTNSTKGPKSQTTLATGTTVTAPSGGFADTLRVDFNGDSRADLVLQHLTSGATKAWLLSGTTRSAERSLPSPAKAWRLATAADFNGDGHGDLVWQNPAAAAAEIHLLAGAKRLGTVTLSEVPATWQLAAAGDFTGDGLPDLVFQDGTTGERLVLALARLQADGLRPLETLPIEWDIAGAGDFNADGAPDLLLQNLLTGECQLWLLRGTSTLGRSSLGRPGVDWEPAGAADVNGDGRSDILWEHPVSGERLVWLLSATGTPVGVSLGRENPGWILAN